MSPSWSHDPAPVRIAAFHRYQCKVCKRWVSYSEETGKWFHMS